MPKAMTEPVLSTIKKGDKHCQHKLYSSVATLLNMPLSTRATSQCVLLSIPACERQQRLQFKLVSLIKLYLNVTRPGLER